MIKRKVSEYQLELQKRAISYNKVFDKQSPFTEEVLMDLAKFCRAHESTFHQDPRLHAVLEGRREVWLRIQECLNLTIQEIYDLHKIKEFIPPKDEG